MQLKTQRLILRRWKPSDVEPFFALNSDPEVMRHFPSVLTLEETKCFVAAAESHFDREGFGLWALELVESGEFIGFTGLSIPRFTSHFTPCVEVGWRLSRKFWGKGYAPEAAKEAVRDGFERFRLPEIVSFTAVVNKNSIRVMEKLGMTHDPAEDFDHPNVQEGHPLRRHVLYRMKRQERSEVPI